MKKNYLSIIIAILMILGLYSMCSCSPSESTDGKEAKGLEYELNSDGITAMVVGIGTFNGSDLVIPATSPDGVPVTQIKASAFANCTQIKTLTISEGITTIGYAAFYECTSLESVSIPNTVTLMECAFAKCTALKSVVIPASIEDIGDQAFYGCTSLKDVTISEGMEGIGPHAFSGCSAIENIVIPEGVTSVAYDGFSGCTSLKTVTIPKSLTWLDNRAFGNCTALENITYNGTKAEWEAINKEESWNKDTASYTVHCTDGDIAK